MRARSFSPFLRRTYILASLAVVLALFATSGLQPVEAFTPIVNPAVAAATSTNQLVSLASCSYLNFYYIYFIDKVTSLVYYATSTDGSTWTTPVLAFTATSVITWTATVTPIRASCTGQAVVVAWQTVRTAGSQTGYITYVVGAMGSGSVVFGSTVTGPKSQNNNLIHAAASGTIYLSCLGYLNGIVFYCDEQSAVGMRIIENNIAQKNETTIGNGTPSAVSSAWTGLFYILFNPAGVYYQTSYDGITWQAAVQITQCNSGAGVGSAVGFSNTAYMACMSGSTYFFVSVSPAQVISGTYTNVNLGTGPQSTNGGAQIISDGVSTIIVTGLAQAGGGVASAYWFSSNSGSSWSTTQNYAATGTVANNEGSFPDFVGWEGIFSSTLGAFVLAPTNQASTFTVYDVLFGVPTVSGVGAQVQTVGSCPAKNTATTTLVNNTEYFYTAGAINPASISLVSTFVAQVTSATAPQTLSLGIYATLSPGGVSGSNTFFLIAAFSRSLSAGTTNSLINWSPGVSLAGTIIGNIPTGATIGVAVLGTNKIKINQSSLSGMTTAPTAGGVLAGTLTALSANAAQLNLCMTLSYQAEFTTTTTITSSTTVTTTSTNTVAGQVNPTVIANSNFMLAIIVILGPSLILAAATKSLWGGILGALLGGAAGAFIGFLPFWVPVVIVIGCITVLFFARGGGGDKM